jgi:hypothetical protein
LGISVVIICCKMLLDLALLVRYKLEILGGESAQVANHDFAILS